MTCRIVFQLSYRHTAGAAPIGAWERLDKIDLSAKIFRVPHHGGDISEGAKTYSVTGFYQEVSPELSVFSVGTNHGYGHPLKSHMLAAGVSGRCRRLSTQLTPQCHASPASKYDEARMNASRVGYDYRHHRTRKKAEIPCPGTVIVSMNHAGDVQVRPAASDWHDRFVRGLDNPLCISV